MKAVILCSGKGERLRPITYEYPKPMLLVHGKPILEHIISLLKRHDVTEIFISVYHLKEQIMNYFGDGTRFGVSISYIEEDELSGTGGPLAQIKDKLTETFFVMNGDELKDLDLDGLLSFHKKKGVPITIALTRVEDPSSYGVARMHDGLITEFVEKPRKEEAPSNCINSGLYVFEPEVLRDLPKGFSMLEKDIFPLYAKAGKVSGCVFDGQWFDTGTFERYEHAIKNWNDPDDPS